MRSHLRVRRPAVWAVVPAALAVILTGCGGGKKSVAGPSPDAPVIANLALSFTQQPCTLSGLPGTLHQAAFDYTDANGDLRGGTVTDTTRPDVGSPIVVTGGIPQDGVQITGTTTGRITLTFCVRFNSVSTITETVSVTDAAGHQSNELSASAARPAGVPERLRSGEGPAPGVAKELFAR